MRITHKTLKALLEDLKAVENREGDYLAALDSAVSTVEEWVEVSAPDPSEGTRYYSDDFLDYEESKPYGDDTARIIDIHAGVIAYSHKGNAADICQALEVNPLSQYKDER